MFDRVDAYCTHETVNIPGSSSGSLNNLNFAAKDLFEVEGHTCCAGNPVWLATHKPALRTASVISALIKEGASLCGKTICDELAFSLLGENVHYGTPVNSSAPSRVPGGSSSGSAAIAAAGTVDFSIGTDTAGSVRVPASYCGIYGIRPTHGVVSTEGVIPLAPGFDTVGWFSRSAEVMAGVGNVLLPQGDVDTAKISIVVPRDIFSSLLTEKSRNACASPLEMIRNSFGRFLEVDLGPGNLDQWASAFGILRNYEAWKIHGEWIRKNNPAFEPAIKERFEAASKTTEDDVKKALPVQRAAREYMERLLPEGGVLCLPTTPGAAPLRNSSPEQKAKFRKETLALTCIATITGMPQVTMPLGMVDDAPFGISFIGRHGSDRLLLEAAKKL